MGLLKHPGREKINQENKGKNFSKLANVRDAQYFIDIEIDRRQA